MTNGISAMLKCSTPIVGRCEAPYHLTELVVPQAEAVLRRLGVDCGFTQDKLVAFALAGRHTILTFLRCHEGLSGRGMVLHPFCQGH